MWGRHALVRTPADSDDCSADQRQWALDRLARLLQRCRELERMRAPERPVPVALMRRAVFAAYCEAISAGGKADAVRMLRDLTTRSRPSG